MGEMVERVALTLFEQHKVWFYGTVEEIEYGDLTERQLEYGRGLARAAIAAMSQFMTEGALERWSK